MRLLAISAVLCAAISLGAATSARASASDTWAWGAISIDRGGNPLNPHYGLAGGDTEAAAIKSAQDLCQKDGGEKCEPAVSYQQCGAYAAGLTGSGTGVGDSTKAAEAAAMTNCKDGHCQVIVSDCN